MLYIGADHAGFKLKEAVKKYLDGLKYKYEDLGALKLDPKDDYPDYGARVAKKVSQSPKKNRGILVCGTGVGMCIVAGKFKGVRPAAIYNIEDAKQSRMHGDTNVLCLAGLRLSEQEAKKIVKIWLGAKFAGGRHIRRLRKIAQIEKENLK